MKVVKDAATAFRLPTNLLQRGYTVRRERSGDIPFLRRLYASVRAAELAQVTGWSAGQKAAFLDQQFDLQRLHYRTRIDRCRFHIIERDAQPVGRLYLQQRVATLHVVDISLLPAVRDVGLGTALLRAVIDGAASSGRGVGLSADRFGRAMRLYHRLGFVAAGETDAAGLRVELERPPMPTAPDPAPSPLGDQAGVPGSGCTKQAISARSAATG